MYADTANNIARIYENEGNAQAALAQQRGQIWGQTLASLGGQIAQIPQQIQQRKLQDLQLQTGQMELQQHQQQILAQRALDEEMRTALNPDGSFNREALQKGVINRGLGHLWPAMDKQFTESDKLHGEVTKLQNDVADKQQDAWGAFGAAVRDANYDPGTFTTMLAAQVRRGYLPKDEAAQYLTQLQQDPSQLKPLVDHLIAGSPAQQKIGAETTTANARLVTANKPNEATVALEAAGGDPAAAMKLLKPGAEKSFQRASMLVDGKPTEVLINPDPNAAQKVFDLEGKPIANAAGRAKPMPPASVLYPHSNPQGEQAVQDVKETVAGMKDGSLPPQLPGRATKEYLALMAEAHRQGFDLAKAATDWQATQKHISSMNGAQQLRLNQSINQLPELLDKVDALADKWKGGRFPLLNKANLALAKGGAFGKDAASIANQLDAQISDVVADLGNVYMGGNSPTDHALGLAQKSLSADWDQKVLKDMTQLARANVKTRLNSIKNTGVAGASDNNPYAAPAPAAAPAVSGPTEGATKPIPGYPGTEQTYRNGKWIRTK